MAVGPVRIGLAGFVLDLGAGELLAADGRLAGLRKQALEVLLLLGRRAGQVVTKDELMTAVWPDVVVGEGSLTQVVADIRKVLDDKDHRLVRNVARRGYMLVPDAAAPAAALAPAPSAAGGRTPAPRQAWAAAGAVLLLVAIGAAGWLGWDAAAPRWLSPQAAARPPPPGSAAALSIAILPLTVEGDAEGAGWLADALHGDLITQVARAPGAVVIARDTMATYKGKATDPRRVARELGVRHVVRGSLRREGEQIRLNLALVDGQSGVQSWGDTFVADRAELPRTLTQFVVAIERALQAEMYRVGAAQRERLSPDQVSADDLAMQAYALWFRGFTRDNVLQALAIMERAVQLDPDSYRAWNGISYLTVHAMVNGWLTDRDAARQRIQVAADQLERIDRDGTYTYSAKTILAYLKADVEAMLQVTRAWTERHPAVPNGFGAHGGALMFNGRFDEAVAALERALRLSPRDPLRAEWHYRLAMAHFAAGRYELARDWAQSASSTNPGLRWPPVHAAALRRLGRDDDARRALADYEARHGPFQAVQIRTRMPGNDPRFADARERLAASLAQTGSP